MANTLKILVNANSGNQTVSNFTMAVNDKIEFQNAHATGGLVVKIKGYDTNPNVPIPFCHGNNQKVPVVEVPANSSKTYHICNDFTSGQFAYEATIAGTITEDPIVIIEKSGGIGDYTTTAAIALFAFIAGAALTRFMWPGKAKNPG